MAVRRALDLGIRTSVYKFKFGSELLNGKHYNSLCNVQKSSTVRHFSANFASEGHPKMKSKLDKLHLPEIKNINMIMEKGSMEISWFDESEQSNLYPFVWLRDHCQCESCFHPISRSRTMLFDDLDIDIRPTNFKLTDGTNLSIEWSDGHISHFNSQWLKNRTFGHKNRRRKDIIKLERTTWGSDILQNLPVANFLQLMSDDRALLTWLQQLEVYGFVMIMNVPKGHGQVRKLVDKVAFIKKTHYGADFSVKAKSDASNVAYSTGPLQLHTDLPYYYYKPGIQLIHCLVQFEGNGAESQVADAVHVAKLLKKENPEMYQVLTDTSVDWCDIGIDEGREFHKVLQNPVICLDSKGEISRVNISHPQRDSYFNVDLSLVPKWYQAMKLYSKMLYDPQNCLKFKMLPDTIQSFDNLRIVHGRTSYSDDNVGGERELQGCYMDWDEARSKRRVLEAKFHISKSHF